MRKVINEAKEYALLEIKKYNSPSKRNFDVANKQGQQLAKEYPVNKEIILLGTILMDIKLGENIKRGTPKNHIKEGIKAAENFLSKYNLSKETTHKVLDCVAGHHGNWKTKEGEICANADCYRFLTVNNWKAFFKSLDQKDALKFAESKLEEKWKILSLPECRKELKSEYNAIKEIIKLKREYNKSNQVL